MINAFQTFNPQNNDKSIEMAKLLVKAARETRTMLVTADAKSKKARDGIATQDKATMWGVLQEYISQYAAFIKDAEIFTGIGLYKVGQEFYEQVTVHDIEVQLQMAIGFVYAKEAFESARKEVYKQCLKKLIKNSGLLSDAELKQLWI